MMNNRKAQGRDPLTTIAFGLAMLSCVVGLCLCLIKSPQAKSADYLTLSRKMMGVDAEMASSAAWEAARLNPASPEVWDVLAGALAQTGDEGASKKARVIAIRLHKNPSDRTPLYAMPAELRLSLLASRSGDL